MKDYKEINRQSWNERTDHHYGSEFYDVKNFIKGSTSLNEIELKLLGDINDQSVLHLQCHFGQDTLSMARMGAHTVGVDLSDKAIEKARELSKEIKVDSRFICCDLYDLPDHLEEQFDKVYTSYGTIGWLPDLNKWAELINKYLKPGGRLIFVEFHPLVWIFDDNFQEIKYKYFKTDPIIEDIEGTYADKEAKTSFKTITWNHALSEVVDSLLNQGLNLEQLKEYDYSPYDVAADMIEVAPKKYRIKKFEDKIPLVYSLVLTKNK